MRAKAEVLRVVRAVLSLSLMQPRPRLPTLSVTPLRPAEHYHTCGELELNRKTRGLHVKCWYNTTAHTQSESPASWRCQRDGGGLSNAMHLSDSQGGHAWASKAARAASRNDTHSARRVAHSHIRHNCETIALSAQMSSMSAHRHVP